MLILELQSGWWTPYSNLKSFWGTWRGSSRLQRELKAMAQKGSWVAIHNKVAWAKICPDAKSVGSLGHKTNTKDKLRVQLLIKVATKEKNCEPQSPPPFNCVLVWVGDHVPHSTLNILICKYTCNSLEVGELVYMTHFIDSKSIYKCLSTYIVNSLEIHLVPSYS